MQKNAKNNNMPRTTTCQEQQFARNDNLQNFEEKNCLECIFEEKQLPGTAICKKMSINIICLICKIIYLEQQFASLIAKRVITQPAKFACNNSQQQFQNGINQEGKCGILRAFFV